MFGPALFARQRSQAQQRLATVLAEVEALNTKAQAASSRRSAQSLWGEVAALLRKHKLGGVVEVRVETDQTDSGRTLHQVVVEVDQAAWTSRRAADGVNLVIAHPDSIDSAAGIVQHYFFDKDKVERDFRTIQSVLQLRPVHHRTDAKVRAHVSLCVLALLLERTLERELKRAGITLSPRAALDALGTCFRNRFQDTGQPLHPTTQATPDQRLLLDALGLSEFIDDAELARTIAPR